MKLFLILSISFICSACTIVGGSRSEHSKQNTVCVWPEIVPPLVIEAEIIRAYPTHDGKDWNVCDIKPISVLKNELQEELKAEIKVGGYSKDLGMNQKYILGLAYCSNPESGYKFEIINIMKVSLVNTADEDRIAILKGAVVSDCVICLLIAPPVVIEAEVIKINKTHDGRTWHGYDIRPIRVLKNELEEKLNAEIKVVFSSDDYFKLQMNQKYILGLNYYYKPQTEYKLKIENLMNLTTNKTINRK